MESEQSNGRKELRRKKVTEDRDIIMENMMAQDLNSIMVVLGKTDPEQLERTELEM